MREGGRLLTAWSNLNPNLRCLIAEGRELTGWLKQYPKVTWVSVGERNSTVCLKKKSSRRRRVSEGGCRLAG